VITGDRLLGTCPPVGVKVESDADVGRVWRLAVTAAGSQAFDRTHWERVSLVATEMATHLMQHARGGRMFVRLVECGDLRGVELVATDAPGMDNADGPNPDRPSANPFGGDGQTPNGDMGLIARVSDLFDLYSVEGQGTVMMARLWGGRLISESDGRFLVGSMTEAITGEVVSGDAWAVEQRGARAVALVADGLGHGVNAAAASTSTARRPEKGTR